MRFKSAYAESPKTKTMKDLTLISDRLKMPHEGILTFKGLLGELAIVDSKNDNSTEWGGCHAGCC